MSLEYAVMLNTDKSSKETKQEQQFNKPVKSSNAVTASM